MSVQALPGVREPSPPVAAPQPDQETDSSFDARWSAWIERGRQHDLAAKRKLRIALLGVTVIGLLAAIFSGLAGAR